MIQKIYQMRTFKDTLAYVMEKDKAEFLETNMIANRDVNKLTAEFMGDMEMNLTRQKVEVLGKHIVLSWHPDERLDSEMKKNIAKEYLEEMGYKNCNYVIVEHKDQDHEHIHMIVSRLDFDTRRLVKDGNEKYKGRRISMELEDKYDLVKTARYANMKVDTRLKESYGKKYDDYVKGELSDVIGMFSGDNPKEFVDHMEKHYFKVQITEKRDSKNKKSYSFSFENEDFIFSQKKLGLDINKKLQNIKNNISKYKYVLPIVDEKKLKEHIGIKVKEYFAKHKKDYYYNVAFLNYNMNYLSV